MQKFKRKDIRAKTVNVRTISAGAAVCGVFVLLVAYFGKADDQAPVTPAPAASTDTSVRFGPGVWTEAVQASQSGEADTNVPDGIAVTAEQHLVINHGLKDVFDHFLLVGHLGAREEHISRLLVHLKATLPVPAFQEAEKIMRSYVSYLDAHDTLAARDAIPTLSPNSVLTPPEVEGISRWLAQRTQLRQEFLGTHIAQVWFGEEEIRDQQIVTAIRQRGTTASPQPQDMVEKSASYGEQREHIRNRFGEQAAQRFDAIEGQERMWKTRYAGYRQAVDNILRQPGLDPAERARQITTLRQQTFTTEQERLRVESLDNLPPPAL